MIEVGKIANMLYMIDLLNTGNIYTLKELSELKDNYLNNYKKDITLKSGDDLWKIKIIFFLLL